MPQSLIGAQELHAGSVVQVVDLFNTNFFQTGISTPTADNTVPLITEGIPLWSLAITPKFVTSKILIISNLFIGTGVVATNTLIQFIHNGTVTLRTQPSSLTGDGRMGESTITFLDSPGTTSPITYFVRFGGAAGSKLVNGAATTHRFGASGGSSLTLMEIKA